MTCARISFCFRGQRDEALSPSGEVRVLDAHDATDERTFGAAWGNEKKALTHLSCAASRPEEGVKMDFDHSYMCCS